MALKKMARNTAMILVATSIGLFTTASIATAPKHRSSFNGNESITTNLSDYAWPTDAGNIGTSTFGEYRRTHFHGGIDISTGNSTGYRVFAVRDGYVARIRVSPTGYGKMLYIRHADGYYSTYAHLSHFNAEIDARVAREQLKQESFPVDVKCAPGEFPVKKGDIIAYTGDTGVGTPHLHFEIRDANMDPINPLLCTGFNFPDNIAPTIKKIALSPLGDRSTVNGSSSPRILSVRQLNTKQYKISETLQLTGEIGFGINVTDRSNGSGYKHGVYSHRLFIDDSLLYTVQLDRVPGRNAHEIGLYYDWNLIDHGRGRFEKLYSDSPRSIVFHSPTGDNAGAVNTGELTEGRHVFRIVSTDFNGNNSEVTGNLIFNHPPHFEIARSANDLSLRFADIGKVHKVLMFSRRNGSESWSLKTMTPVYADGNIIHIPEANLRFDVVKIVAENAWGTRSLPQFMFLNKPDGATGTLKLDCEMKRDFVRIILHAQHPFTEIPRVHVYEGQSMRTIVLTAVDIDKYIGAFTPLESFAGTRRLVAEAEVNGTMVTALQEFALYPIVAGRSGNISLDGGKLIVEYDSLSVFKTVFMEVQKHQDDEPFYTLLPENTVLKGELRVTVFSGALRPNQGLFFSGIGDWELLDQSPDGSKQTFTGVVTRTLGDVMIRTDDTPPNISRLSIRGATSRRPTISFRCGDNFSGVEYQELKMYIDGVAVIPEVDGEHHRATYTPTRPLERGSHLLTIRIMDKMGNSSKVERQFSAR
ncbi:MAG: family metallopeptidase [Bacteroidetes bacterium]|nr:family metallopeptidase [Bacteroidota bacterium]